MNKKKCRTCGHANPAKSRFCAKCGTAFKNEQMNYKNCENCGQENPVENRFCSLCGTAFKDSALPKSKSNKKSLIWIAGIAVLVIICLLVLLIVLRPEPTEFSDANVCTVVYKTSEGVILGTTTMDYENGETDTIVPPNFNGYVTPGVQVVTWDSTRADTITFVYSPAVISYTVVYSSNNGTILGNANAEYLYGTVNTINPPDFDGYATPTAQVVAWDSPQAKTITFIYHPIPAINEVRSGIISGKRSQGLSYSAEIEYQNRTANSIQLRIVWTTTISGTEIYDSYGQRFVATVESVDTGTVIVTDYGRWKEPSSTTRSATAKSEWITVPLSTTDATTLDMHIYYYQVNRSGKDVTRSQKAAGLDEFWTINVPAY